MKSLTRYHADMVSEDDEGCLYIADEADARIAELEAERDAARADAERLDAGCIQFETRDELGQPMTVCYSGVDLRAAIDAARGKA